MCKFHTLIQFSPNLSVKNFIANSILFVLYYFCQNSFKMAETTKKSTALYWVLFFLSIAAFFGVYAVGGGYCSMVLPFVCTFFALAMDLM